MQQHSCPDAVGTADNFAYEISCTMYTASQQLATSNLARVERALEYLENNKSLGCLEHACSYNNLFLSSQAVQSRLWAFSQWFALLFAGIASYPAGIGFPQEQRHKTVSPHN